MKPQLLKQSALEIAKTMASNVTLRDVASLAGVATGTASQALNGKPNIALETREKVLKAALSLGYITKKPIAHRENGRISTIGMLVKHDYGPDSLPNPFYGHIQMGVESECRRHNINLMYATIEVGARNHPVKWPTMIRDGAVDCLLLIGTFVEDTVEQFNRHVSNLPVVLIDGYAPNLPFDSVVINNVAGAESVIEHLVTQGHRAIGLIGWNQDAAPSINERHTGYLNVLRRHKLDETYVEPSLLNRESGADALRRLLVRAPHVSAVFACNDDTAVGVLSAARELGVGVPDDLSVTGFDNVDLARDISPALTTVHVHKRWMGMMGVRQLIARSNDPDMPKMTITIDTDLVVRDSSMAYQHS